MPKGSSHLPWGVPEEELDEDSKAHKPTVTSLNR
jgi:hypothetical protein